MSIPMAFAVVVGLLMGLYIQAVVTKSEKKWLVMVLPTISFIVSIIVALLTNPMETLGLTIVYKIVMFGLGNVYTVVLIMVSFSRKYGFRRR